MVRTGQLRVESVGLSRGACATVARIARKGRSYVYKVAVGQKRGNATIRRQLAKRGWRDPLALSNSDLSRALRAIYDDRMSA